MIFLNPRTKQIMRKIHNTKKKAPAWVNLKIKDQKKIQNLNRNKARYNHSLK